MDQKYLDSPCQELSNGGLESVVTLLVRWQIDYSSASTGSAVQLYDNSETTVGKLLAGRIQIFRVQFCIIHFDLCTPMRPLERALLH